MKTANDFVEEYLFNQDNVLAETIINTVLKEHFKFTATGVKPLITRYKELAKAYQQGLRARIHKVENEMPLWYVPTERGLKFMPGVLAEHMQEKENVFYAAEQHYLYRGGVYQPIHEMEAQKMVRDKMISSETKMNQITDAERQWRLLIRKEIRELNANPFIINVQNGLYNVQEDTLTEHSPAYNSTIQLSVNYDPKADCPKFKQFLFESMGGDMGQVELLQEMLGYFLIPVNSAQKCFVIVGAAGAGKSVLLRVLNELLLGKENVSNVSWQALNERFKTAELFGKLANIFADLPTKNIDDNGIFKALVGEDFLTVEKKNKDPFSFRSNARLLFSCNSIPKNYGDRSDGFYRRLIIVRFNHTVPVEQRDPNLLDKFRIEADGIFLFALEGLRRLMKNHYVFSETDVNRDELQQYREESDSVLSFMKECCEIGENNEVGSTDIFNCYKAYCEECGLKPFSQKMFVSQIIASNPQITRSVDKLGKKRTLSGIKLGEILD
jgi:putative DNA primase/helicase